MKLVSGSIVVVYWFCQGLAVFGGCSSGTDVKVTVSQVGCILPKPGLVVLVESPFLGQGP